MKKENLLPYSIIFLGISFLIGALIIFSGIKSSSKDIDSSIGYINPSISNISNAVSNLEYQISNTGGSGKVFMVQVGENRIGILNQDNENKGYASKIRVFEYNPQTQKWSYISTFDFNDDSTYNFNIK